MTLPHQVGADVRRLTLSQRVRRERDQSLVTSAPTLAWLGSRPQCTMRDEHEDKDDWFKAPIRVNKQMQATHEPTLTRPCGHPLPSDGRGAGGEGSLACRFMAPIRVQKQVETTHEPPPSSRSRRKEAHFYFRLPIFECRMPNAERRVHGPNSRPKVGGRASP